MHADSPSASATAKPAGAFRAGSGSHMEKLIAETDWSQTDLGDIASWPERLKACVELILASGFPMALRWGPKLITIYNDAYAPILGDKHPQALGRPASEVWPEIYEKLGPLHQSILRGERNGYYEHDQHWTISRRAGRLEDAYFTISYSPIYDKTAPNGIGGILVIASETTTAVDRERRYRDLNEHLETEIANRTRERDRIWQVAEDLLGISNFDGYFTSVNPAWTTLLGWSADEISRMHVSELRHPDDAAEANEQRERLAKGVRTVRMENRFRHKDGSWRWLFWTLTAADNDIYAIGRDITARKESAARLLESEQQFSLLVNALTDYALYRITPEGIISSWNIGAERAKGYVANEIIGQHFSKFYTPEDRALGLPATVLQRAAAEGRFETEGWRVRKDGTQFWANVVVDAIYDRHGTLLGFVKITRDITERLEAQKALQRTQEQLAQAQKMDALGQLTGGIAHDFNNMLMVVGGYTQFLKGRLGNDKDKRAVEAIEIAASRAEKLTRQLLTFSRRQPLQTSVVNLSERLDGFRDILTATATGNVRLHVDVPKTVWPVKIDLNEFEVAIINLLVNARDAMEGGGTVRISGHNVHVGRHDAPFALEGDFVVIEVQDNGSGISADILPKIFDPFFSTKTTDKGTGLGLSQVHGFARQAGGAVTVTSEVGTGTTIALYLPRADENAALAPNADGTAALPTGKELILLVEDNPEVQSITTTMLEQLGYRILAVGTADQALSTLVAGKEVDLVFSDIVMPGALDGLGLARQVRARFPQIPILLTTGYAKALSDPFDEFVLLRKPYQITALAPAVRAALDSAKPR